MKNFQSTTEGIWTELLQVTLTEEQEALFNSDDEADTESKHLLMQEIKALSQKVADETDASVCQSAYENIKPSLKESDMYQLISADISLIADEVRGILNYRLNGEHIQLRF